MMQTK